MSFLNDLRDNKTIIFDGGMGSLLAEKGLALTGAANNLDHPKVVQEVHEEYLAAGSRCLITNTLTLNEIYMNKKGALKIDLEAANRAAVVIAQEAIVQSGYSFEEVSVFGDMGPTGELLAPLGSGQADDFYQAYLRQAKTLAEAGVSGFIVETVFDLEEALLAVKACREISPQLPVIMSITFSTVKKGCRTVMGNKAIDCAERAAAAGVDVVGTNCGDLSLAEISQIVTAMKPAGLPIIVQPNAGKPVFDQGRAVYNMSPDEFAEGMKLCHDAGAQVLGGCCGTTPEHIRALCKLLESN
ncbi:MAG: homocysteine S-methyltransferase family protein [Bacillota bacterium]